MSYRVHLWDHRGVLWGACCERTTSCMSDLVQCGILFSACFYLSIYSFEDSSGLKVQALDRGMGEGLF